MLREHNLFSLTCALALILPCFVIFGCGGIGSSETAHELLRFINLVNGRPSLNVEIQDVLEVEEFDYGDATTYFEVAEGTLKVEVEDITSPLPVATSSLTIASGSRQTVLLAGDEASITFVSITDTLVFPEGDDISIRFINGSPSVPSVDVYVVFPGQDVSEVSPVASSLASNAATEYFQFDEGDFEIVYVIAGTTEEVRRSSEVSLGASEHFTHILLDRFDISNSQTSRLFVDN